MIKHYFWWNNYYLEWFYFKWELIFLIYLIIYVKIIKILTKYLIIMQLYSKKCSLHLKNDDITEKIEGLFHIIPFKLLRHTNKVDFHSIPYLDHVNSMERVIHDAWAKSPWIVWDVKEGWYMHSNQEDNLITLDWVREVELYHPSHKKIEKFEISANYIKWNWKIVLDWPWILWWPTWIYHKNNSLISSSSLNLWIRYEWFDVDTEFNIYDVDTNNWKVKMIRKGSLDQPSNM